MTDIVYPLPDIERPIYEGVILLPIVIYKEKLDDHQMYRSRGLFTVYDLDCRL